MREVIVDYKTFLKICEFSSKYASSIIPRKEWVECMGYLFCRRTDTQYFIDDAVGMTSGNDLSVEMDIAALGSIESLEKERPGLFLGGWFHTHPGLSPFYSDTDIQNQTFYQQHNEDGLGIVFDLNMVSDDFIGFKIFRNHSRNAKTYYEVEFKLQGFTEKNLKEALDYIGGITKQKVHNLAVNYGFGQGDLNIIQPVQIPIVENPIENADDYYLDARKLFVKKDFKKALEKMRIAAGLYEAGNEYEMAAETHIDVAKYSISCGMTEVGEYSLNILENFIENEKLGDDEYYRGKLEFNQGLLKAKEENFSIAAEHMESAMNHFDPNEDFEECYGAVYQNAIYFMKMKSNTKALNLFKRAKIFALKAKEEQEDGDENEKDWTAIISLIDDKINKLQVSKTNRGLERII